MELQRALMVNPIQHDKARISHKHSYSLPTLRKRPHIPSNMILIPKKLNPLQANPNILTLKEIGLKLGIDHIIPPELPSKFHNKRRRRRRFLKKLNYQPKYKTIDAGETQFKHKVIKSQISELYNLPHLPFMEKFGSVMENLKAKTAYLV